VGVPSCSVGSFYHNVQDKGCAGSEIVGAWLTMRRSYRFEVQWTARRWAVLGTPASGRPFGWGRFIGIRRIGGVRGWLGRPHVLLCGGTVLWRANERSAAHRSERAVSGSPPRGRTSSWRVVRGVIRTAVAPGFPFDERRGRAGSSLGSSSARISWAVGSVCSSLSRWAIDFLHPRPR